MEEHAGVSHAGASELVFGSLIGGTISVARAKLLIHKVMKCAHSPKHDRASCTLMGEHSIIIVSKSDKVIAVGYLCEACAKCAKGDASNDIAYRHLKFHIERRLAG